MSRRSRNSSICSALTLVKSCNGFQFSSATRRISAAARSLTTGPSDTPSSCCLTSVAYDTIDPWKTLLDPGTAVIVLDAAAPHAGEMPDLPPALQPDGSTVLPDDTLSHAVQRIEILDALANYSGAVVLVSHDEAADPVEGQAGGEQALRCVTAAVDE